MSKAAGDSTFETLVNLASPMVVLVGANSRGQSMFDQDVSPPPEVLNTTKYQIVDLEYEAVGLAALGLAQLPT